jgi:hypothetical protein
MWEGAVTVYSKIIPYLRKTMKKSTTAYLCRDSNCGSLQNTKRSINYITFVHGVRVELGLLAYEADYVLL